MDFQPGETAMVLSKKYYPRQFRDNNSLRLKDTSGTKLSGNRARYSAAAAGAEAALRKQYGASHQKVSPAWRSAKFY